jgi:hypothetical protein
MAAAFIAKGKAVRIRMATGRACSLKFKSALPAEVSPFTILNLTFRAFHFVSQSIKISEQKISQKQRSRFGSTDREQYKEYEVLKKRVMA